ncbi:hypothetical protein CMV_002534 [Castanea mollissima]|uniref:Uncharacterized protein n=1 Tax=Castanea mollissima TaxID=60419 RepID=A0A8J4S1N0_9ROSI|nr:hypothetical protein CMV_002534 [Castanea mollissima]
MIPRTREEKFLHRGSVERILRCGSIEGCADLLLGIKYHNRFLHHGSVEKFLHCESMEDCADLLLGIKGHNDSYVVEAWRNLKELDLTGNLLSEWKDVSTISKSIRILVLNDTGIKWTQDIGLSENPVADPGRGGTPRFVLIARLAKVEILNGSEVSPLERKDSEIRYVRLIMSKLHDPQEIKQVHPRVLLYRYCLMMKWNL